MKIKKLIGLFLICSVIATYFVQSVVTVNADDAIKGDVNNDGIINMADVILLAGAFNAMNGDSKYSPAYDLNNDGVINMADVIIIAGKFNTVVGDPKYDEACDLNSDGAINMSDVIIIAGKFNTVVKDTNVPIAKASTATLMIMFIGAGTVIKYLKPKK